MARYSRKDCERTLSILYEKKNPGIYDFGIRYRKHGARFEILYGIMRFKYILKFVDMFKSCNQQIPHNLYKQFHDSQKWIEYMKKQRGFGRKIYG